MTTILTFHADGTFHCDGLGLNRNVRIGGGAQPGQPSCTECPRFAKCGMSHVATVATEVTDLAAVKLLCKEQGWTFLENQKTYKWYGTSVGDYPLPEGLKKEDLGKCAHAISVPGAGYEIGLVKTAKGYRLAYDFWGPGQKLKEVIGENGGRFLQGYGVAKATLIARSKGYMLQRSTLPNGTIRLRVSGM